MGVLGNQQHERFCQELHKLLWAGGKVKDSRVGAYQAVGYESTDDCVADNARKLANRKEIKVRLAELADYAAKLAGIDAAWGQVKLKGFVECNLDDFLDPPDSSGVRHFNVGKASRAQIGQLAEITQEEWTEKDGDDESEVRHVQKTKIKPHDPIAALALMAKIGGWVAPTKISATDPSGQHPSPFVVEIVRFSDATKNPAAA